MTVTIQNTFPACVKSTVERQKGLTAVLAENDFLSFLEQFLPIFSIKKLSLLKPT